MPDKDYLAWHVYGVQEGYGNPHARMIYYVQRYINDPATRYTGERLCIPATPDYTEASFIANRANRGEAVGRSVRCYL